jgi:putative lipoprotein
MIRRLSVTAAALLALACGGTPKGGASDTAAVASNDASPQPQSILEREWTLVTIGDSAAPPGSGGKPATLRFDSAASRASGFAGCNRYSAQYTIAGDSLHFGPAMVTRMACVDGDALERAFLPVISAVTGFHAADSTLTLTGSSGTLASFRAR